MTNKSTKIKSLAKDTGLFAIGSFGSKLLLFLLTPLYTNILTTEQYGITDLINTTINFIYPVFTLSISEATLRFLMDKNYSKRSVLNNSLLITAFSFVAVFIIKPFVGHIDESLDVYWIYFFVIFCLTNINLVLSNFVKGIGKTTLYAVAGIIHTIVIIICNVLFLVYFKFGINGYLLSIVIGISVSILLKIIFGNFRQFIFPIQVDAKVLKDMLVYCIPMIPTIIAWAINTSIDKYMIINLIGMSENGIYSVAHKIPTILTTVLTIFLNAWQLSAINNHGEKGESEFQSEIYNLFNIVCVIGCLFTILLNKPLAKILFAKDFYVAWRYVPLLTTSALFAALAGFLAATYRAAKKTKSLFVSVLIGAVINVVLNFILLKFIGTIGAAIATGISFFAVWLFRIILIQKIVPIKIDFLKTVIAYVLFFLAVIIESFGYEYSFIVSLGVLLVILFVYRNDLTRIYSIVLSIIRKKTLKKQNI